MATNHDHFERSDTWKEILSQGHIWPYVLEELEGSKVLENILRSNSNKGSRLFVGCGTSFYLAEAAASSWTTLTGEFARAVPASEILLYPSLTKLDGAGLQAIVISRSGQTSEAVRAARILKTALDPPTIGITCAENSELEVVCDSTLVIRSADEKSTVMTRSFTSMLLSLQFLAAVYAGNVEFAASLHTVAKLLASQVSSIAQQIETFVSSRSFADYIFLGQGPFYGIAREAALKVMEMSCSYSQFFHTLEFRHGPKAIVGPQTCLMFFLSQAGQRSETEVLEEMKDLGGVTVAICNTSDQEIKSGADLVIELNLPGHELTTLAPYIIPGQLMGFFTGIRKGLNPDQPKNLSRVVILD